MGGRVLRGGGGKLREQSPGSLSVHCLDPQSVCCSISEALRVGGLIVGIQVKYKVPGAWGTGDLLSLLKSVL